MTRIEKNIPPPVGHGTRSVSGRLAEQMDVNDSVHFKTVAEARTLVSALARRGRKGKSRKVEDGYRVWRVE